MIDTIEGDPVVYLGDGVYASFDGFHIWLHIDSHDSAPVVALEPDVLKALVDFDKKVREKK